MSATVSFTVPCKLGRGDTENTFRILLDKMNITLGEISNLLVTRHSAVRATLRFRRNGQPGKAEISLVEQGKGKLYKNVITIDLTDPAGTEEGQTFWEPLFKAAFAEGPVDLDQSTVNPPDIHPGVTEGVEDVNGVHGGKVVEG